jgi:hypothetical protein
MHGRIDVFVLDTQALFFARVADVRRLIGLVAGNGYVFFTYGSAIDSTADSARPFARIFRRSAQSFYFAASNKPAILAIMVCCPDMRPVFQYLMGNGRRMPLKLLSYFPE